MPKLKFYDVKAKKSFETDKFTKFSKGKIQFAKTTSPLTGITSTRILGRNK